MLFRSANLSGAFLTVELLMRQLKTKRYTWTRLQRILLYALFGLTAGRLQQIHQAGPTYLRVLGLRRETSHLLKRLPRTLPLLYNPSEMPDNPSLLLDAAATDIYSLGYPALAQREKKQDYSRQVVVL
mgnify:CR=1 FL=1